jgi:hypothetical protein
LAFNPVDFSSSLEWWTLAAIFAAAFATTVVPAFVALKLGGFRGGQHWSLNARAVTSARALIALQPFMLGIGALAVAIERCPSLAERVTIILSIVAGWWSAAHVVGRTLTRVHAFPKPVVAFEGLRALLLSIIAYGALLSPVLAIGLHATIESGSGVVSPRPISLR